MTASSTPNASPSPGPRPRTFRLAATPSSSTIWKNMNPYVDLFYGALRGRSIETTELQFNDAWLKAAAPSLDAIHVHWPSIYWRLSGATALRQLRGVIGIARFFRLAGRLGLKRIWTAHDLRPIEQFEGSKPVGWVDRLGHQLIAAQCELIICHSKEAVGLLREQYRTNAEVVVMRHGNYGDVYPSPRPRSEVVREFGLDEDRPIVCCLGTLRPSKGLEIACEAVRKLDGRVQLIIAGNPLPQLDVPSVREMCRGLGVLVARRLSEQEYSDVLGMSEAMLLPYHQITGSGALLSAWTKGAGVIGSDLPFFQEMLEPEPDAGRLFPVGDASALAEAIESYLAIPRETRIEAVSRLSRRYDWDECVIPVVDAISEWMNVDRSLPSNGAAS